MESRMKHLSISRIGIITIILYSITILIYFIYFYEPYRPIYGKLNNLIRFMQRENMLLIYILVIAVFSSVLGKILYNRC